jgi:DNA-binding XRE family transcriptional regulator
VRKIRIDGSKVKQLRNERDRKSTQKEFAHEVDISERKLRAIENADATVGMEVAERIARALNKPVQSLMLKPIESPAPLPSPSDPSGKIVAMLPKREILPRFDDYPAGVISDEASMFEFANNKRVLISHVLTSLTAETSKYVEELLAILKRLTWEGGSFDNPVKGSEEISVRRRIRELLVLLKGNDVWVYGDTHIKILPESFEVQPHEALRDFEMQAIVAFGPPGEYGETTIKVPVDHGQPREVTWS